MFGDSEKDPDASVDPPDNTGGTGKTSLDTSDEEVVAVDPPDHSGGTK